MVGRIGGVAALGGAFVSAIFLTSWPGGPPGLAIAAFVFGVAGGTTALLWPRSLVAMTTSGLLLALAFVPLALSWGVAYLPSLVLVGWATLRAQQLETRQELHPALVAAEGGSPLDDLWVRDRDDLTWRTHSPGWKQVVVIPDADEPSAVFRETDDLVIIPQTDVVEPLSSRNGLVHVGPPGVIGGLKRRPA